MHGIAILVGNAAYFPFENLLGFLLMRESLCSSEKNCSKLGLSGKVSAGYPWLSGWMGIKKPPMAVAKDGSKNLEKKGFTKR